MLDASKFISKVSQLHATSSEILSGTIPPQLPDDQLTEALSDATVAFDAVSKTALISNFLINLLVSGSLNLLWGMINSLQILTHFPLINVLMPANSQMLFSVIVKIATFDVINVDPIMEWLDGLMPTIDDSRSEMADNFK